MDKPVDEVDNPSEATRILAIFAKEPVPGQVKTRLTPPLSPEQAAGLYRLSLRETVDRMTGQGFTLAICYAGNLNYFQENFPGLELFEQIGNDLGARMDHALQSFLRQGYRQAVLIGSDSPDLPLSLVRQAFAALQEASLVIAPAHDGGYVLIGESCHTPELFVEMPWSSAEILALTRQRAEKTGIEYRLLQDWDDLDDLAALRRFLKRSPATKSADFLRRIPELKEAFAQS